MTLICFEKAGIALPKVSAGLGSSVPAEPKTVANLRPKAGAPCGPNAGRGSCTVSDNWAAYVGGLITREGFEAAYGRPCTGAVGRPRQPSDQLRFLILRGIMKFEHRDFIRELENHHRQDPEPSCFFMGFASTL
jgi:hypothetical protein